MPEFLLSVHATPAEEAAQDQADADTMQRLYAQVGAFNDRLQEAGAWVWAGGLQPSATASVVDATDSGDKRVSPGPRGTGSHRLGGFWVVAADDMAAAVDWAAQASAACEAPVEVRPFQVEPDQD